MDAKTKLSFPGLLACLGLLVLTFGFWPLAVSAQESKTYVNQKHGFSLQYPAAYGLKGAGDYLDFTRDGETWFTLKADDRFIEMLYQMLHPGLVVYREGQDPYQDLARQTRKDPELFRRYAREQAKHWYAADGPDGSVYWQKFQSEKAFTSRGGLDCLELRPVMTREDFNRKTTEQETAGPVWAVFLPRGKLPLMLILTPAYGKSASATLIKEMRQVVDSIEVAP